MILNKNLNTYPDKCFFTGKYKNIPISNKKIKFILNMIRNKNIIEAVNILTFLNKKASFYIKKLLKSIVYNAKNNNNFNNINKLKISKIFSGPGKSFKKIFIRAKGRCDRIKKRYCNLTIILESI